MRTTLRIDDDLMMELKRRAQRDRVSLTQTVNTLLRRGLESSEQPRKISQYRETTYSLGEPSVNLDKALGLASTMEDEEIRRKFALRK